MTLRGTTSALRSGLFLAGSALLAGAALASVESGCGGSGSSTSAPDGAAAIDAAPVETDAPVTETAPPTLVDAGVTPVLTDFPSCPLSLFIDGVPQDFSTDAAVASGWVTQWVKPVPVAGGALQFGPHPMNENWWENYSPITSNQKPGDVLTCARVRVFTDSGNPDSDTFELTMRLPDEAGFETSGMALQLQANASAVVLHTRTSGETWITHDTKPLPFAPGAATLDVLLYGQGETFAAEVRNVDTGATARLHASYALPPGGAISMVGWRNRQPWFVDRLVVGIPMAPIAKRLMAP